MALTAHMTMATLPESDEFLQRVARELHEHFGIDHATLQLEREAGCLLSCARPAAG